MVVIVITIDNMTHEDILREVGLSTNESKVYESLLGLEHAHIDLIAVRSKVHRRNIYDSIAKLVEKGLVTEVIIEGKKHYRAINPSRLMDIVAEKEKRLGKILPDLQSKFVTAVAKEQAYVYKGIRGFRNYMQDILDVGKDGYFIGAKGGWFDERLANYRIKFMQESKKKRLKHYHLFDYEMKEKMPYVLKQSEFFYKLLPKEYSTTSAIDVFGDYVVTFTGLNIGKLDDDITQFVIVSKGLADAYRTWFRMIWDILPGEKFKE
ncbi:MAG: helix-turn-helix domain-containing protein [Candidatus Micrarchaeota archaeon]|nr:helix-turn-helix domain-containing protein [Candidatus Micrarchaeota archaeon]